jgi:hypothetical protein
MERISWLPNLKKEEQECKNLLSFFSVSKGCFSTQWKKLTSFGWKHIKVEYIILSHLVGLLIMGHGTKYKWLICEKDSK